jgi:hypothetical protein
MKSFTALLLAAFVAFAVAEEGQFSLRGLAPGGKEKGKGKANGYAYYQCIESGAVGCAACQAESGVTAPSTEYITCAWKPNWKGVGRCEEYDGEIALPACVPN